MPYTPAEPSAMYHKTEFYDMNDKLIKIGDIICYGSKNTLELGVVKEIKYKTVNKIYKIISIFCVTKGTSCNSADVRVDVPTKAILSVQNNVCYMGNAHEQKEWMPKVKTLIDYYFQSIGTIKQNEK